MFPVLTLNIVSVLTFHSNGIHHKLQPESYYLYPPIQPVITATGTAEITYCYGNVITTHGGGLGSTIHTVQYSGITKLLTHISKT